jgi:hypothetical protein
LDGFDDNLRRRRGQSEANDEPEAESSEEEMDDEPSQTSKRKGKRRLVSKSQLTQYVCCWSCAAVYNNNLQNQADTQFERR